MKRFLVGYDDSAAARRALERALVDARDGQGRITVLAVFEVPLDPQVPRFFGTLDDVTDWEGQPIDPPPELVELLATARDRIDADGVEAEFMWAAGDPGRAIVDVARDGRFDVVVLGEHHHGFLAGVLGTDVATQVRRELGCDVIVA